MDITSKDIQCDLIIVKYKMEDDVSCSHIFLPLTPFHKACPNALGWLKLLKLANNHLPLSSNLTFSLEHLHSSKLKGIAKEKKVRL